MSLLLWAAIGIVLVAIYAWYASIVTRRNRVSEALAGIDVQLTQRHDLIPNVLQIARRFMDHERGLMDDITAMRAKASQSIGQRDFGRVGEKFAAEEQLGAGLGRLFAVAENYPALTSAPPMMEAQRSYQEVETNIAAARRFYNSAVGDLRNAIEIFPGSVLAGVAGVRTVPPFFEATEQGRSPVEASTYL